MSHSVSGSIIRIGPNVVVTNDYEAIRRIHSTWSGYKRSPYYDAGTLVPPIANLYSERDESRHAALKMQTAAAVSRNFSLSLKRVILMLDPVLGRKSSA